MYHRFEIIVWALIFITNEILVFDCNPQCVKVPTDTTEVVVVISNYFDVKVLLARHHLPHCDDALDFECLFGQLFAFGDRRRSNDEWL